jgi:hypothetical protein
MTMYGELSEIRTHCKIDYLTSLIIADMISYLIVCLTSLGISISLSYDIVEWFAKRGFHKKPFSCFPCMSFWLSFFINMIALLVLLAREHPDFGEYLYYDYSYHFDTFIYNTEDIVIAFAVGFAFALLTFIIVRIASKPNIKP